MTHRALVSLLLLALPVRAEEPAAPGAPPLRIVRVKGTPREMGAEAGRVLREQVRLLLRDYLGRALPGDRTIAVAAARQMERHIPERYREEMKALAEAAGVPYDDVLLGNVMVELFQQCSAAVVRGARAEGGTLLLGRNLDFPPEGILEKHSVVIEYEPEKGRPFVAVTWPGLVGVLSGMNRDGLAVANLLAIAPDPSLDGCPYMFLLRDVLEGAETVEQGIAILRKSRRTTANSIVLADAKGAAVAEATHGDLRVREIEEDRLFATNDFRTDGGARCDRYDRLAELVSAAKAPFGAREMERLLDAVDLGDINVQSMIFVPARRELIVSLGRIPAAKGPFVLLKPWE